MKSVRLSEGIRRAFQTLVTAYADAAVTLPQAAVLRALVANGPISQTQLVEASGTDRSTLSDVVRRLVARNYLSTTPIELDRRAKMVTITGAGRAALQRSSGALSTAEAAVMRLVPAADRPAFLRCLRAIAEAGGA